jgi:hypothetical protein
MWAANLLAPTEVASNKGGRIGLRALEINLRTVFASQNVGINEAAA